MPQAEISIAPLAAGQLASATALFDAYPYKEAQRAVQRLDRARLNDFYAAGLARGVAAGTPHWIARDAAGAAIALGGLAADGWHSEVYGFKMGKLQPWLNTLESQAGEPLLAAAESHARAEGYEHLSVRIDGEDFANLHLFENAGYRLVDVSLKFSRPMPVDADRLVAAPAGAGDYVIDLAAPEDHDWIRRIGGATHGGTHFLNDPHLPADRTRALFSQWLERCLARLAYRVYVIRAPGEKPGTGVGFVTYLRNRAFAEAVGRNPIILDFVLLDPQARCGGLGPWFIAQTLARENESGFDYCELRTSAHNLGAVGCYEKLGMRCCATDFVLHKRMR